MLASWKNHIRFPRYKFTCRYNCRRVLKHVSKAQNIFHTCRTQQSQASSMFDLHKKKFCGKCITCDKVVPCKLALSRAFLHELHVLPEA